MKQNLLPILAVLLVLTVAGETAAFRCTSTINVEEEYVLHEVFVTIAIEHLAPEAMAQTWQTIWDSNRDTYTEIFSEAIRTGFKQEDAEIDSHVNTVETHITHNETHVIITHHIVVNITGVIEEKENKVQIRCHWRKARIKLREAWNARVAVGPMGDWCFVDEIDCSCFAVPLEQWKQKQIGDTIWFYHNVTNLITTTVTTPAGETVSVSIDPSMQIGAPAGSTAEGDVITYAPEITYSPEEGFLGNIWLYIIVGVVVVAVVGAAVVALRRK